MHRLLKAILPRSSFTISSLLVSNDVSVTGYEKHMGDLAACIKICHRTKDMAPN